TYMQIWQAGGLLGCLLVVLCVIRSSRMPGNQHIKAVISFGAFAADLQSQELRKRGVRLRLPGQSFQILKMLLERPGELVTREDFQKALWPSDTFVDFDHSLNAANVSDGHKAFWNSSRVTSCPGRS